VNTLFQSTAFRGFFVGANAPDGAGAVVFCLVHTAPLTTLDVMLPKIDVDSVSLGGTRSTTQSVVGRRRFSPFFMAEPQKTLLQDHLSSAIRAAAVIADDLIRVGGVCSSVPGQAFATVRLPRMSGH